MAMGRWALLALLCWYLLCVPQVLSDHVAQGQEQKESVLDAEAERIGMIKSLMGKAKQLIGAESKQEQQQRQDKDAEVKSQKKPNSNLASDAQKGKCCRICPNVFYALKQAPWAPEGLRNPNKPSSFLQEVAEATMRSKMKARRAQPFDERVPCCNVCQTSYTRDLSYPGMLNYDAGIPHGLDNPESPADPSLQQIPGQDRPIDSFLDSASASARRVHGFGDFIGKLARNAKAMVSKGMEVVKQRLNMPTKQKVERMDAADASNKFTVPDLPCCRLCPLGCLPDFDDIYVASQKRKKKLEEKAARRKAEDREDEAAAQQSSFVQLREATAGAIGGTGNALQPQMDPNSAIDPSLQAEQQSTAPTDSSDQPIGDEVSADPADVDKQLDQLANDDRFVAVAATAMDAIEHNPQVHDAYVSWRTATGDTAPENDPEDEMRFVMSGFDFGGFVKNAIETGKKVVNHVTNAVKTVAHHVTNTVKKVVHHVKNAVQTVAHHVNNVVSHVKRAVSHVSNVVKKVAGHVGNFVSRAVAAVKQVASKVAGAVRQHITRARTRITQALTKVRQIAARRPTKSVLSHGLRIRTKTVLPSAIVAVAIPAAVPLFGAALFKDQSNPSRQNDPPGMDSILQDRDRCAENMAHCCQLCSSNWPDQTPEVWQEKRQLKGELAKNMIENIERDVSHNKKILAGALGLSAGAAAGVVVHKLLSDAEARKGELSPSAKKAEEELKELTQEKEDIGPIPKEKKIENVAAMNQLQRSPNKPSEVGYDEHMTLNDD